MLLSFLSGTFAFPSLSLFHSLFLFHFKPLHCLIVSFFIIFLFFYSRKSALVPAKQPLARRHALSDLLSLRSISWAEDEGLLSLALFAFSWVWLWMRRAGLNRSCFERLNSSAYEELTNDLFFSELWHNYLQISLHSTADILGGGQTWALSWIKETFETCFI